MSDPFAFALKAMLLSPMAVPAVYRHADGSQTQIRAIASAEPADMQLGSASVTVDETMIGIDRDAVPAPVKGDQVEMKGAIWDILAEPRLDKEGVTWMCELAVAP